MKRDIGELLVESGQITKEELNKALQSADPTAEPKTRILLRSGLISEENLKSVLELHYGVNYLDLKKMIPDPAIMSLVPKELVLQYELVPVQTVGNRLTLAMVTPSDTEGLRKAKQCLGEYQLKIVCCTDDGFENFLTKSYAPAQSAQVTVQVGKKDEKPLRFIELVNGYGNDGNRVEEQIGSGVDENRAIVLLSNHIIANAISKGCSNIHIEPNDRQVLVHYRKEGILFPARKLPIALFPDLVQRFKIMAAQAAEDVVLPYDGVLNVRHDETDFSFRLSIIQGAYGEHLVIWLG